MNLMNDLGYQFVICILSKFIVWNRISVGDLVRAKIIISDYIILNAR